MEDMRAYDGFDDGDDGVDDGHEAASYGRDLLKEEELVICLKDKEEALGGNGVFRTKELKQDATAPMVAVS